jgi:hypothetical protein
MKLALLLTAASLLHAEEVTKVVDIKYADVGRIQSLIPSHSAVNMRVDPSGKLVVFRGERVAVEGMEEILKRIDVAPSNVELVFHLLSGSKATGKPNDLPPSLAGVVKEMKSLFGFQTVTLIDTIALRVQEGRDSEANGLLPTTMEDKTGPKANYNLSVKQVVVSGPKGSRQLRIGGVRFSGRIPMTDARGNTQFADNGLSTGLDLKEGQHIVIGKVGLDSSSNPFFLVVSAKVVD